MSAHNESRPSRRLLRAFTLLETLLALLAMSGSVLILSNLTKLLQAAMMRESHNPEADWSLFCGQLRAELAGSHFEKIEQNFLYVKKGEQTFRFGKTAKGDDFRKTNAQGQGYQPMLYHVAAVNIVKFDARTLKIDVKFDAGGDKTFLYPIKK